jgi:hypothetical protein
VDVEVLVRVDVVLPDLTDGAGLMRADQATLGLDLARNPRARRQLACRSRVRSAAPSRR